jgi:hypothetical protein
MPDRISRHSPPRYHGRDGLRCSLLLCSHEMHVLFDPNATYSFISHVAARKLNVKSCMMSIPLRVGLSTRDINTCVMGYKNCSISVNEVLFFIDLIHFDLTDFDIILEMNWLMKNEAKLDCERHRISLRRSSREKVYMKGDKNRAELCIISMMQAQKILRKGYDELRCNVMHSDLEGAKMEGTPIV